jgi:hypothetical protein
MNTAQGKDHCGQAQDAAYRQIDSPGNNDERHAAGQDAEDRALTKHIPVGAPFEKGPVAMEYQPQQNYRSQRQQGSDPGKFKPFDVVLSRLAMWLHSKGSLRKAKARC